MCVCGNEGVLRTRVFKWFKHFQNGREDVEDDLCPDRPSTSNTNDGIEEIGNLVRSESWLSIRVIVEAEKIGKESIQQILHSNFGMQKVCDRTMPTSLTFEQQQARKNISTDTLNSIENSPNSLKKLMKCDELWF
ncbi:putative mariner transposase [Trichonephila clavipes]|nr:putative mariner transposase [Trichonephila clavipes]